MVVKLQPVCVCVFENDQAFFFLASHHYVVAPQKDEALFIQHVPQRWRSPSPVIPIESRQAPLILHVRCTDSDARKA